MTRWSYFFSIIPVFGVGMFAVAQFFPSLGWNLPEDVSKDGYRIDRLYYFILVITGLAFVASQGFLIYILFVFGKPKEERGGVLYIHGNRKLEITWTVIPAIILAIIAFVQLPAWMDLKFPEKHQGKPLARVLAKQFEWRFIYPGPDGEFDTVDDLHVISELHVAKDEETLLQLRSMDVLHSFFLPHLRVKQDANPGRSIPIWFTATKSTKQFREEAKKEGRPVMHYELVCAELCGWGHYKMKGRLIVHESRTELDEWLDVKYQEQEATR